MANLKDFWWPPVDTVEECRKTTIQAASAYFTVALITAVAVVLRMSGKLADIIPDLDASALLDAGLFFILGIFVYRNSRLASLIGVFLYGLEQAYSMAQGQFRFNFMMIVVMLFMIHGVRSTVSWHDLKSHETPPPETPKKKNIFVQLLLFLLIVAGVALLSYSAFSRHSAIPKNSPRVFTRAKSSGLPKVKLPEIPLKLPFAVKSVDQIQTANDAAKAKSEAAVASIEGGANGEKVSFKLKNGSTVSGKIIYEDETYFTLETLAGQEIVVKEDIAERK